MELFATFIFTESFSGPLIYRVIHGRGENKMF